MYGIDQRTNASTQLPPLAYPPRHCLSCLCFGQLAAVLAKLFVVLQLPPPPPPADPADRETASAVRLLRSHFSSLSVFHSIQLEEEEEEGLEGAIPVQVYVQIERSRDFPTSLSLSAVGGEQVVISRVSPDDIIPHVSGKIKPTHTHTNIRRGNIVTADATPQGTKLKPDPGSYLYSLPRFTHNFTGSLGTHAIRYYL